MLHKEEINRLFRSNLLIAWYQIIMSDEEAVEAAAAAAVLPIVEQSRLLSGYSSLKKKSEECQSKLT